MNIPILEQLKELADIKGFTVIDNVGGLVSAVVGLLLLIAALASFVFFVLGGLKWLTAGGDKGKVEEAKTQLTNAVIGLAVVAASWAVFLVINTFFGLGLAGSGGSSNSVNNRNTSNYSPTKEAPPGYCLCGNGYCTKSQRASRGLASGQCYSCNTKTGGWNPIAGDMGCRNLTITCDPCP